MAKRSSLFFGQNYENKKTLQIVNLQGL